MLASNRQQRAMQLLENRSSIKRIDGFTYEVRSQSVRNRFYCVRIDDSNNYSCECADFSFRALIDCKHILGVKVYRQFITKEMRATLGTERPTSCPRCGHNMMQGDGTRNVKDGLKQIWRCPKCSKRVSSRSNIQMGINTSNGLDFTNKTS